MITLSMDPLELSRFQGERSKKVIEDKYLNTINNSAWRGLAQTLLTMEEPASQYAYPLLSRWDFAVAPGSGAHHTHFGGLALHTLQNLEYADTWASLYERRGISINRDLLYATIIIHDTMKRFIYRFGTDFAFEKSEDPFIAKHEDHHSWVLRELNQRGCDKELLLSVAAIHGTDDVSLQHGVQPVAVVNHYLSIGNTGLVCTQDDIRPEHIVAFLSDSDWHWSGQAQRKTGLLSERLAAKTGVSPNSLKIWLGSVFSYEQVGSYIEQHGYELAAEHYAKEVVR